MDSTYKNETNMQNYLKVQPKGLLKCPTKNVDWNGKPWERVKW